MPTILLKKSDTPGSVPGTANLTNLAGGVEVAVNTADKRMFSMTSASAVIELGTNPSSLTCADASFTVARITSLTISSLSLTNVTISSATVTTLTGTSANITTVTGTTAGFTSANITNISGTSLTVSTATLSGGTANGVLYLNGSKVATSGSALVFDGTTLLTKSSTGGKFTLDSTTTGTENTITSILNNGNAYSNINYVGLDHIFKYGSTELARFTSGGNLGIGTSSPSYKLDVNGVIATGSGSNRGFFYNDGSKILVESSSTYPLAFSVNGAVRATLDSSGNLGLGVTPSAYSYGKALQVNGAAFSGDSTTWRARMTANAYYDGDWKYLQNNHALEYLQSGSTGSHTWNIAASGTANNIITWTSAMTLDASGNLSLGTTTSGGLLTLKNANPSVSLISVQSYANTNEIGDIAFDQSTDLFTFSHKLAAGGITFQTNSTERARITAGGDFIVNGTTVLQSAKLSVHSGSVAVENGGVDGSFENAFVGVYTGNNNEHNVIQTAVSSGGTGSGFRFKASDGGGLSTTTTVLDLTRTQTIFYTGGTERARITAGGDLLVGTTTAFSLSSSTATGVQLTAGAVVAYVSQNPSGYFGRQGDDGTIIDFRQDGVTEGTISVSGNTVSYNAFAGSHWSQLQDGSKPDILRGTVMESINELCVWPDEQNERLPKAKISDTAGSKKVYGVFMAWDNDWTTTNDMYVTAVGAFICRVNGSVTVQEGDLLESNGDGTARVQADDIIRSSTIGKVTSTVKTHQYDDGSYCVPTVLYCG